MQLGLELGHLFTHINRSGAQNGSENKVVLLRKYKVWLCGDCLQEWKKTFNVYST